MTPDRRWILKAAGCAAASLSLPLRAGARTTQVAENWTSLTNSFRVPEWYRDAKFGIWAHWGPQCAPESGDWYGRLAHVEGDYRFDHFRRTYGHQADKSFIDVITGWRAERWNPEAIVAKYKAAGARFVMAMACHHDNFDLFPSAVHGWNSTRIGPQRDIVGGWTAAIRKAGLRIGLSNHASHAWHWWQTAYGYDTQGPRKGERYAAHRLTRAHGVGTAWDGLDPDQLFTGHWMVPPDGLTSPEAMRDWHDTRSGRWMEFAPPGERGQAYARHWLARQMTLVDRYQPDIVYQDGYRLPFGPIGIAAAAHFYNSVIARTGSFDGVMTAGPTEGEGTLTNIERGFSDRLRSEPWQTATCIGDWHYNRSRYLDKSYVPARHVIQRLIDVVSKNGTLLLSVPVRGDGTTDSEEDRILADIGAWLRVNGRAIYGTRPWDVFGEGSTSIKGGNFSEGGVAFGSDDIRFTQRSGQLFAAIMAPKAGILGITALRSRIAGGARVDRVSAINGRPLRFRQEDGVVAVDVPKDPTGADLPLILEISGEGLVT